jgi:hypothetical protein
MEFIHFLRVFIFNKKNHNKQGDRTNSISVAPPWCYVIGFFYLLEKKKGKERMVGGGTLPGE